MERGPLSKRDISFSHWRMDLPGLVGPVAILSSRRKFSMFFVEGVEGVVLAVVVVVVDYR